MVEKLINAFDEYDVLVHKHIPEEVDGTEDMELVAAAEKLNRTAHEIKMWEKEIIEKLRLDIITAAGNVNDSAKRQNKRSNYEYYGSVLQCEKVLRLLRQEVSVPCYEDCGYSKIPRIVINGTEITYHNG